VVRGVVSAVSRALARVEEMARGTVATGAVRVEASALAKVEAMAGDMVEARAQQRAEVWATEMVEATAAPRVEAMVAWVETAEVRAKVVMGALAATAMGLAMVVAFGSTQGGMPRRAASQRCADCRIGSRS
jgi:hypothetical protein